MLAGNRLIYMHAMDIQFSKWIMTKGRESVIPIFLLPGADPSHHQISKKFYRASASEQNALDHFLVQCKDPIFTTIHISTNLSFCGNLFFSVRTERVFPGIPCEQRKMFVSANRILDVSIQVFQDFSITEKIRQSSSDEARWSRIWRSKLLFFSSSSIIQ